MYDNECGGIEGTMDEKKKDSKRKLFMVTSDYPNQGGDSVFVLPELPELAARFDLTVICTGGRGDCKYAREDVTYLFYDQKLPVQAKLWYALKYFLCSGCQKELLEIWKTRKGNPFGKTVGRIYKSLEFYACGEKFYRFFMRHAKNSFSDENVIYYTFWCNAYSLPMILHKKKHRNFHMITRLHGYDLFEERYLYGRQPFKTIINEGLERLFFVAGLPMQYYQAVHKELDRQKTEVCRLGVYPIAADNARKRIAPFLLISCSNMVSLKRIPLLIEALSLIEEDITWIHLGDGTERQNLEKAAGNSLGKKGNIQYEFKGNLPNEEIRQFYSETQIDCFITVSATEGGAPVSIMEAMAAKTPVIGTAVGDIPAMIDGNGILLAENPSAEEIADAVRRILSMPETERRKMGERSFHLWEEYFHAEKNARIFGEKVESIGVS